MFHSPSPAAVHGLTPQAFPQVSLRATRSANSIPTTARTNKSPRLRVGVIRTPVSVEHSSKSKGGCWDWVLRHRCIRGRWFTPTESRPRCAALERQHRYHPHHCHLGAEVRDEEGGGGAMMGCRESERQSTAGKINTHNSPTLKTIINSPLDQDTPHNQNHIPSFHPHTV